MSKTPPQTIADLITRAKYLGRELANELMPEQFAAPLRAELVQVNEAIRVAKAGA